MPTFATDLAFNNTGNRRGGIGIGMTIIAINSCMSTLAANLTLRHHMRLIGIRTSRKTRSTTAPKLRRDMRPPLNLPRPEISDGENFAVRPPFEAPFLAKASSLPPLPSPPLFSNRKPGKRRWRRRENQLKLSTSPATFPAISSCAVTWNR
ncbi:hypothetical protein L3X38_013058 [Prunus dulcis]|uniref:Uncharacterized protein n=1 Tax=Prunus dulcis TaxID=3755 RepID=A0AAD4WN08_PRUDU|nr:hypothetical protein L3X38_013058 [Prunus dulcis]